MSPIANNILPSSFAFILLLFCQNALNTNFSVLMSYYLTKISPMIPITALVTFSSVKREMVVYLFCYTHTYTSISKFFLAQASAFGLVLNCLFFTSCQTPKGAVSYSILFYHLHVSKDRVVMLLLY